MGVIDEFVSPILDDAVKRAKVRGFEVEGEEAKVQDDECLLDHLVRHTQGEL